MTDLSEAPASRQQLIRRQETIALVAGLVTLVLAWATRNLTMIDPELGFAIVGYAALYAILLLLSYTLPSGLCIGLQNVAILAIFLSSGTLPAVAAAFIGATGAELARVAYGDWAGWGRQTRKQAITVLFDGSLSAYSTIFAGVIYIAVGGPLPVATLESTILGPVIVLIGLAFVLYQVPLLISAVGKNEKSSPTEEQPHGLVVLRLIFIEIVFAVVAPLMANVYYYKRSFVIIFVMAISVIMVAWLFRETEYVRRRMEQRLRDITFLHNIGQSLATSLSPSDLLRHLYQEIGRLLDNRNLVIAQYDSTSSALTFPLVIRNGNILTQTEPAEVIVALTKHIIQTHQPLQINAPLKPALEKIGLSVAADDLQCYLGTPMIVGDVIGVISVHSTINAKAFGPAELMLLNTVASRAAVSLRNATLYDQTVALATKLTLLNNVSSVITATLDLDRALEAICQFVIKVGDADKTGIFLSNGSGMRLAYSVGLSDDYAALFRESGYGMDDEMMRTIGLTEVLAISDVQSDTRALGWRSLAEVEDYRALVMVPLVVSEESIGYLAAFYQQPQQFNRSELDMMSTLANQVAVTVANARLYQDTQNHAQEMTHLVNASRAFTSSLDLKSVAERVLDELGGVLSPDTMVLMMVGSGTLALKPLVQRSAITVGALIPKGSIAQAIKTCQPMLLPSIPEDRAVLDELNLRSLYVIPLVSQEKTRGLVMIGYQSLRPISFQEQQLIEALVNQAATAITNAQMFTQIDSALQERVTELEGIEAISRKISGSLDLDEIIAAVLDSALAVTHAALAGCGLITLNDPEYLTFTERYSQPDMMPLTSVMPRNVGVVGKVMQTRTIAWISDIRDYPHYYPSNLPDMLSELCVPILHKDEVLGAINVESHQTDAFTVSHKRFLATLADHTALAIGNTRLFEESQAQIEMLNSLRKLSSQLLWDTTLKKVMKSVVYYTLIITHARDVHLYLYERGTDTLTFGASLWYDSREDIEAIRPSQNGRTYQVARTGQLQLIENINAIDPSTPKQGGYAYGAIARMPLKRADQVFGVLVIAYREIRRFTENDVQLLELVANQSAIALANVHLFEEISAARDQMQVILDSARDGMVLVGINGELMLVNPAAERLLNHPLSAYLGQKVLPRLVRARRTETDPYRLKFLTEGIRNILSDIRSTPDTPVRQNFQIGIPGGVRDLEGLTLPVCDEFGNIVGRLLVIRDVSEEKSIERFREEVTNMLIHDLRAPLSIVISSLRLMKDMISQQQYEDLLQLGDIALQSSENQLRMIESLLEIAKADTLNLSVNSLNDMVQAAMNPLEVVANEASIKLINRVPTDFPPLMIDESKITRVLVNLIDNALRYTPNGGEIRIDATLTPNKGGELFSKISVIDTGKGIPEELRGHIFDKFFQVAKTALRGYRGAGLGLTFCKRAVEAHGGEIWVESGPEGGAAFWITLPVAPREATS